MKRQFLSYIAPCAAIAGAFIGLQHETFAQSKAGTKAKKSQIAQIRAQNAETQVVKVNSVLADEEILDRDLDPAVRVSIADSCVPPNCINVFDPNRGTLNTPDMSQNQQSPPVPPSADGSPLTNPDSVLSPNQQSSQMPAPVTSLAAGQGASTAMSYAPAFMGDFFGGSSSTVTSSYYGSYNSLNLSNGQSVSIPSNGGVGIMKLAENTSPLPRDRVFVSYNYFSNVNLAPGGIAVNRITPGFEKTFFGGNASVEVRVPMALTLGSNSSVDVSGNPTYNTNQYELGNVTTYFKALLYRDEKFALSSGVGFGAPTANNTKISDSSGNTAVLINNQAWNVMPFIGSVYTPNDRWFAQSMLQFDFAANGNTVSTTPFGGGSLQRNGSLNDPTYLFASIGTGYWMYQNRDPSARLSRVSLISELHFNSTLQHTDFVQGNNLQVGSYQSQIQTLNAVVGTNIMFDQNKSLLLGYVCPIGASDQAFAGEFRVLFNWYFGPYQNRATRVQF